ncbi:hypothetical protein JST97_34910, partial [bacterium]|nr:hypothetical protein [bacterium]
MAVADVSSVDEFIASFYEGGKLDSRGVFTIDLEQRSRKLLKYQLSLPENFVLALVRAATLGGASQIDLERQLTCISLRFDGLLFTPEELAGVAQMLNRSAVDSGSRRLEALGLGLMLAANLPHGGLGFHTGSHALKLRGRHWRVEEIDGSSQNLLELERSSWERFLPGRLAKTHQALEQLLRSRCMYGPARLNLDDWFRLDPADSALLINQGPPIPWAEPSVCFGKVVFAEQPDCHGWVSLGGQRSMVVFVSAGVAEVLQVVPSSFHGYQAVFWCDSLQPDLGGNVFVRDKVFMRLLRMLVLWLLQLELEYVFQFYARYGMKRLLRDEASKATLWAYRQQVLLSLEPAQVDWCKRPGNTLPVNLGEVAQLYTCHGWLAIAAESEGDIDLDDGTPILVPRPETEALLQLVFPKQREFFNCYGRAVPRELSLRTVFQDRLFKRHSRLMYDALIGENWAGAGQIWVYENGRLVDVREADARLPSGTTLVQFSSDCLGDEEIKRLLASLEQAS